MNTPISADKPPKMPKHASNKKIFFSEVSYKKGATELFLAIEEMAWRDAFDTIISDPGQARTWVNNIESGISINSWRRLPIHEVCKTLVAMIFLVIDCLEIINIGTLVLTIVRSSSSKIIRHALSELLLGWYQNSFPHSQNLRLSRQTVENTRSILPSTRRARRRLSTSLLLRIGMPLWPAIKPEEFLWILSTTQN